MTLLGERVRKRFGKWLSEGGGGNKVLLGGGERFEVRRRGVGELSICTNLKICHVSGRVFFCAALRWF